MKILPPTATRPILDSALRMVKSFRTWTILVSREAGTLRGTGNPNGAVEAFQDQKYFDEAGAPGNNFYYKSVDDVAGDKTQGWVLI